MQLVKIVLAFVAVGGTGYALFSFQKDAPQWIRVLAAVMGVATLIVAITYLPQAVDALEDSVKRVSKWFEQSPEQIRQRAEAEAKRKADAERKAREDAARRQAEDDVRKRAEAELARQRQLELAAQREREREAAREYQTQLEAARLREQEIARQRARELQAARQLERELEAARQRELELARQRDIARQRAQSGTGPGRMRQGEFIPSCPVGMGYSREHQTCVPTQHLGGVIPCSADDATFVPGRGWVSNCR